MGHIYHRIPRISAVAVCLILVLAVPGWSGISDLAQQVKGTAFSQSETAKTGTVFNTGGFGLNFRSGPWGEIYRVLSEGTSLNILATQGDWFKVETDGKTGFVHSDYVTGGAATASSGASGERYVNVSSSSYLNVRTGPWGQIIGKARRGDKVEVIGREGDWFKVKFNGRVAYMHSDYLSGRNPGSGNPGTSNPGNNNPPPTTGTTTTGSGGRALLGWLQQAGLSGEKLRMAWSIAMGESGGNPRAYNGNSRTGDKSYGLFQINMIGSMGPARRRQFGISSNEQLFDPMTNIRAMLKVSSNGTNWNPWSVYKHGTYRRFYNQYPPR